MMPWRDAARPRTSPSSLAILTCLLAGAGSLFAVSPVLWTQQGIADFE